MIDPKTLPENEPHRHTMQVRAWLTEIAEHLHQDVEKVDDPAFQMLFESTAEVLTGLDRAFARYEAKIGEADGGQVPSS